jgi:hypothetical protein
MNFNKMLGSYKKKTKKRILSAPETIGNEKRPREETPESVVTIYFVHVPKTAGSALKQIFSKVVDEKHTEGWRLKTTDGTIVNIVANGHSPCSNFPVSTIMLHFA